MQQVYHFIKYFKTNALLTNFFEKKSFNSYLYKIVEKTPGLLDKIALRNDVYPRLLPDVTQEFQEIQEGVVDYDEKIEEIPFKAIEEIEVKPEEVEETKIVQEPAVIAIKRIADREEEIDLVEEKFPLVQEPAVIPTERIADRDEEEIDLVEKEELPVVQVIIPSERIADDDKIDLVKEEEIVKETAIIQERAAIPTERDYVEDRDEEKIDLIKEKELVIETTVAEKIPVEKPEIFDEDEIERVATAKIELELPRELEEYCN